MKKNILDTLLSFLGLCLLACGIAAAFFLGVLLMPLVLVAFTIYLLKELLMWKRKRKHLQQTTTTKNKKPEKAGVTPMLEGLKYKKAA